MREADALRARRLRAATAAGPGAAPGSRPRDVQRVQRARARALPARHPPHRGRADVLALPRDRAHRDAPVRRLPGQRARDGDEHARGHHPARRRAGRDAARDRRRQQAAPGQGPRATSRSRSRCARTRSSGAPETTSSAPCRSRSPTPRSAARSRCRRSTARASCASRRGRSRARRCASRARASRIAPGLGRGDQRVEVPLEVPTQLTAQPARAPRGAREGARRGRPAAAAFVDTASSRLRAAPLRAPLRPGRSRSRELHGVRACEHFLLASDSLVRYVNEARARGQWPGPRTIALSAMTDALLQPSPSRRARGRGRHRRRAAAASRHVRAPIRCAARAA